MPISDVYLDVLSVALILSVAMAYSSGMGTTDLTIHLTPKVYQTILAYLHAHNEHVGFVMKLCYETGRVTGDDVSAVNRSEPACVITCYSDFS